MGKFDGVLLCTDFDDTFCCPGQDIPPANLEAVEYFKSQGGRFTVVTGRAPHAFASVMPLVPVNAPVILSNGAHLYDTVTGQSVLRITLPPVVAEDLETILEKFPSVSVEAYHEEAVYGWNLNKWSKWHMDTIQVEAVELPVAQMPQPWDKAMLEQDYELLIPARDYILEHWGDRYEAVFSNQHMLEITAKGCSKGGMVLELAKRLGIQREHIYCVGDNQNDIPMLAVAATAFAPANCVPEVRAWGARILPACVEGTIAALIRLLDEKY